MIFKENEKKNQIQRVNVLNHVLKVLIDLGAEVFLINLRVWAHKLNVYVVHLGYPLQSSRQSRSRA